MAKQAQKQRKKNKRHVGEKIPVQDLSVLKENVMSELEKDDVEDVREDELNVISIRDTEAKSTEENTIEEDKEPVRIEPILARDVSNKPFSNVLLPEEKKPASGLKKAMLPLAILGVAVLIWLGIFLSLHGKPESAVALNNIVVAIENNDVQSFSRHVDVDAVANNVAAQMFIAPEVTEDVPDAIRDQIMAMQNRFDTVIKPALVVDLRTEMLHFVETGDFMGEGQVPTMLTGLVDDLLGADLSSFGGFQVQNVQENNMDAVAQIMLARPDLTVGGAEVVRMPLTVLMEKHDNAWQVVGLPNLNQVLTQIEQAEEAFAVAQKEDMATQMSSILSVEKLTKAAVGEKAMLVALSVENTSDKAIASFTGDIVFMDAGGRLMKEINLTDEDGIAVGNVLSKTWTVPMNINVNAERHLLALPMSSIKGAFVPSSITFEDGTSLTLE